VSPSTAPTRGGHRVRPGQRGTAAVPHNAGEIVTVRPRYPRKQVGDALNQVALASCPPLFAAKDTDPLQIDSTGLAHRLPAAPGTSRVLRVEVLPSHPLAVWHTVRNWTVRESAAGKQLSSVTTCRSPR
jgi:hypothetical protein